MEFLISWVPSETTTQSPPITSADAFSKLSARSRRQLGFSVEKSKKDKELELAWKQFNQLQKTSTPKNSKESFQSKRMWENKNIGNIHSQHTSSLFWLSGRKKPRNFTEESPSPSRIFSCYSTQGQAISRGLTTSFRISVHKANKNPRTTKTFIWKKRFFVIVLLCSPSHNRTKFDLLLLPYPTFSEFLVALVVF